MRGKRNQASGFEESPLQKPDEMEQTERQQCHADKLHSIEEEGIRGLVATPNECAIGEVRNRNAELPGAPGDFSLFDFSAMEDIGNQLLNARDNWAHVSGHPPAIRISGVSNPTQQKIEDWWHTEAPDIAEEIHTFVKKRMAMGEDEEKFDVMLRGALEFLQNHGTARDSQLSRSGLINLDTIIDDGKDVVVVGKSKCSIFPGPTFEMEDCSSQDVRVAKLHFDAFDYGDQVRLTETYRGN